MGEVIDEAIKRYKLILATVLIHSNQMQLRYSSNKVNFQVKSHQIFQETLAALVLLAVQRLAVPALIRFKHLWISEAEILSSSFADLRISITPPSLPTI